MLKATATYPERTFPIPSIQVVHRLHERALVMVRKKLGQHVILQGVTADQI